MKLNDIRSGNRDRFVVVGLKCDGGARKPRVRGTHGFAINASSNVRGVTGDHDVSCSLDCQKGLVDRAGVGIGTGFRDVVIPRKGRDTPQDHNAHT